MPLGTGGEFAGYMFRDGAFAKDPHGREPPSLGWRLSGVRLRNTHPFVLMVGVMLTVSCGGVTAAAHPAKSSAALVASGQPTGTPQQRAAADARAILGEFVPPPGAVRLATRPELPGGSATVMLNSTTQVDAVGYWRVSGTATALRAWEEAHISRSFSQQDVIVGPPDWNTVYTLPAVPGVLPVREMNAQFYDIGGGMTVIMADAMVSWQPSRPASRGDPCFGRRGHDRGVRAGGAGEPRTGHDHVGAGRAAARGAGQRAAGGDGRQ